MKKIVLLFSLLVVALAAVEATATPLPIDLSSVNGKVYQQTGDTPCIFGYSSGTCGNSNIYGYNNTTPTTHPPTNTGTSGDYTLTTQYTVGQLLDLLGGANEFILGYDINQASQKDSDIQKLAGFNIDLDGTTLYSLASATFVPDHQNGAGWADYLITTSSGAAFSLAGYDDDAVVRFTYNINNANDGGEQVWLIAKNAPPPIPEPATLVLFGTSMLGAVPALRRRRK